MHEAIVDAGEPCDDVRHILGSISLVHLCLVISCLANMRYTRLCLLNTGVLNLNSDYYGAMGVCFGEPHVGNGHRHGHGTKSTYGSDLFLTS